MLVPLVVSFLATSHPTKAYSAVDPSFFRAYEDFDRVNDSNTVGSNLQEGGFHRRLGNNPSRFLQYDRPRHRPVRRQDITPLDPIGESRFVNYGSGGHPYERIRRLRERRRHLSVGSAKISGLQETVTDSVNDSEVNRIISEGDTSFRPLRIHFDTVSGIRVFFGFLILKNSFRFLHLITCLNFMLY